MKTLWILAAAATFAACHNRSDEDVGAAPDRGDTTAVSGYDTTATKPTEKYRHHDRGAADRAERRYLDGLAADHAEPELRHHVAQPTAPSAGYDTTRPRSRPRRARTPR